MKNSTIWKWAAGLAGAGAGFILVNALLLERLFFTTRCFHIGNKNSETSPIRIVHLTDLHLRQEVSVFYRRLADKINKLQPDLLLITGDSVDKTGDPETFEAFMRLLDSDIPKFGIMGNHEYKGDISVDTMAKIFEIANGRLLVDETVPVDVNGVRLTLTGLDDIVKHTSDFSEAVGDNLNKRNHLVMLHSPGHYADMVKELDRLNADRSAEQQITIYCALAGHTHGGQVTLTGEPLVLPERSDDYNRGWYGNKPPYLYVSKGFGVSGIPLRMGARSEITVLYYYPYMS